MGEPSFFERVLTTVNNNLHSFNNTSINKNTEKNSISFNSVIANTSAVNTENEKCNNERNKNLFNEVNNQKFLKNNCNVMHRCKPSLNDSLTTVSTLDWHQQQNLRYKNISAVDNLWYSRESCSNVESSSYYDNYKKKTSNYNLFLSNKKTQTIDNLNSCSSGPSTSREHSCDYHRNVQHESIFYSQQEKLHNNNENKSANLSETRYFSTPSLTIDNSNFTTTNNYTSQNFQQLNTESTRHRIISFRKLFCFSFLSIESTFLTFFVFDVILWSHCIVFTVTSYINELQKYNAKRNYIDVSKNINLENILKNIIYFITSAIPFEFILPLFGWQIFWLISGITAILALKCVRPLLQIPYIFVSGIIIVIILYLIIQCFLRVITMSEKIEYILIFILSFANLTLFAQIYFLYVKIICIHSLLRRRKTVVSTVSSNNVVVVSNENESAVSQGSLSIINSKNKKTNSSFFQEKKFNLKNLFPTKSDVDCCLCSSCCCNDTYSTKSTIIISDYNNYKC